MHELFAAIVSSPEFALFVISALTTIAGFVGKAIHDILVHNLSAGQLDMLFTIAANAVAVAEQTGAAKTGEEKKAEAIRVAQTYLDAYGIKVSAAQLEAAIESAVYGQITQFKPVVPAETPAS